MSTPSIAQLQKAVTIAEQIEKLQAELASIVGGRSSVASAPSAAPASPKGKRGGKRTMSSATIAKMRASQQARWAKKKGSATTTTEAPTVKTAKKKRNLSPEGRARLSAAMKARHAAKRAAAK